MLTALIIGIITGYVLSAPPLGPTNFAVMSKGFKKEIREGVAIGAGAGVTDMVYILVAYGGVSLLRSFIPASIDLLENEFYFKAGLTFLGCILVMIYGIKLIKSKTFEPEKTLAEEVEEMEETAGLTLEKKEQNINKLFNKKPLQKKKSVVYRGFFTGVLLCLSSVTLPASWIAIVTYLKGLGVLEETFLAGLFLAVGVLFGTTFWFWTLTNLLARNAHKINPENLNKLNIAVGILLITLGAFLFYKAFDFLFT